jgi:hypothetical protein
LIDLKLHKSKVVQKVCGESFRITENTEMKKKKPSFLGVRGVEEMI